MECSEPITATKHNDEQPHSQNP
jgi:homoserine dehydrogenase